jgi:hypothetical protein
MPDTTALLTDYVAALIADDGPRAARALSPDFTRHQGRNAAAHIAHERKEFRHRAPYYGLDKGFSVNIIAEDQGSITFYVTDYRGRLVYEDWAVVGADGLLIGDNGLWEVINKLRFRQGGDPAFVRAFCIRMNPTVPKTLLVHNAIMTQSLILKGVFEPTFAVCEFSLLNRDGSPDDGKARWLDISIFGATPYSRERRRYFVRGNDHPHFHDHLFPVLAGKRVSMPDYDGHPWCLSLRLADGQNIVIDHPDEAHYDFASPVVFAVLTDAVDHDWEVRLNEE